jgi:flagellar basal-body rod protein FlgG
MEQPPGFQKEGRATPLGYTHGWGSKISQMQFNMAQGSLQITDNPMDLAIEGDGLFEVFINSVDLEGNPVQNIAWTKDGSLTYSQIPGDSEGLHLITKQGHYLMNTANQPIRVPVNHDVKIDTAGVVTAVNKVDIFEPPLLLGQIKIMHVIRPQLLQENGDSTYVLQQGVVNTTGQVLQPFNALANQDGAAKIALHQGFLEHSNVNMTNELTELIVAQKAFTLNARALTSADQMMGLANNLRA